jgi:hypothetical protein
MILNNKKQDIKVYQIEEKEVKEIILIYILLKSYQLI